MHLNTLIRISTGLLLGILLLISGSAYYQAKSTNTGLHTVLDEHIPALQLLMENQILLHKVNLRFEQVIKEERVLREEILAMLATLTAAAEQLSQAQPHREPGVATAVELTKAISATINSSPAIEDSSPSAQAKREQDWGLIQKHIIELRKLLWSHLQQTTTGEASEAGQVFSRLVNSAETDLSRYYTQHFIPPKLLLDPLNHCIENIAQLEGAAKQIISTFSDQDREQLLQLSTAFKRYRSAIVLYYDEDALGVSGANLDEILLQLENARSRADDNLEALTGILLMRANKIQQQIVTSNNVLQNLFLLVAVFGVATLIGAAFFIGRILSKRIGQLLQGAEAIADGDFSCRIESDIKGDALDRLGESFNLMAQKLQQREKEKVENEKKLAQAQKMEAIGLMAGGVAHDLNNILSGIVGYPELLLSTLDEDSKLRQPLEVIRDCGRRAADVVSDLLTVARGVAVRKEIHNANLLIEDYLLSPEADELFTRNKAVTLQTDLEANLLNMKCSKIHFRKSIMNLVTNALEAIEGEGLVTLTTRNKYFEQPVEMLLSPPVGEYVEIRVSDSGSGMSEEDLRRIFEPFYTKKAMGKSGTGLGLPVVWNTVLDHGGGIAVESDSTGSGFCLYFPATRETLAIASDTFNTEQLQGNGELILVVDDEPQQRDIASKMLTMLGYQVKVMPSGEAAVAFLETETAELVLLDMIMEPGISGRETYEQVQKLNPEQKIVIASGYSESDDVLYIQEHSGAKYVKKPYTLKQLGLAVKQTLQQ